MGLVGLHLTLLRSPLPTRSGGGVSLFIVSVMVCGRDPFARGLDEIMGWSIMGLGNASWSGVVQVCNIHPLAQSLLSRVCVSDGLLGCVTSWRTLVVHSLLPRGWHARCLQGLSSLYDVSKMPSSEQSPLHIGKTRLLCISPGLKPS